MAMILHGWTTLKEGHKCNHVLLMSSKRSISAFECRSYQEEAVRYGFCRYAGLYSSVLASEGAYTRYLHSKMPVIPGNCQGGGGGLLASLLGTPCGGSEAMSTSSTASAASGSARWAVCTR